jgi:tetratricopeptide (TPR) repeat protein
MSDPLPTRALAVTLAAAPDGGLAARASLLDVRKVGVVPVGGDLGTPGVVHHMWLDASIDPVGPRLVSLAAHQPSVAFEPSALTGGESCRDPVARRGAGPGSAAAEAERLAESVSRDVGEDPALAEASALHDQLKAAPDAARGLMAVADAQFAKRRYDVALGIYQQASKLDPSASEPQYKAGVAAVALGQMHLAADCFGRVLQLDPGNATAAVNLKMARAAAQGSRPPPSYLEAAAAEAQASLDAGRHALALQQAEKLLRLEVSARAHLLRARARLALRQPQAALQDAGRALALDPGQLEALRTMAEAHRQMGAAEKALYYLKLYLTRGAGSLDDARRSEAERAVKELSQP